MTDDAARVLGAAGAASPRTPGPHVAVSVVHWNGGQSTIECLESLHRRPYARQQIVFVDNGSTDGIAAVVRDRWPDILVVVNAANRGFTGGHNQGIATAVERGADYVLLLNQDATVQPDCIARMVALAESDDRIGLVSPVIFYADEPTRVQFCGHWIDWAGVRTGGSRVIDVMRQYELAGSAISLWGTALLIRRALVADIGVLDERLFAYYEDTDYSLRSSSRGWLNRVCFDAGVLHEGHATRYTRGPHVFYLSSRNALLFWRKAFATRRGGGLRWRRKVVSGILHEAGTLKDAALPEQAAACIDGLWAGWWRRYGSYEQRRSSPRWFRRLALSHPYFWSRLLDGDLASLMRRLRIGRRSA